MKNLAGVFLLINLIIPVLVLLLLAALGGLKICSKNLQKSFDMVKQSMFFSYFIRFYIQFYLVLVVASLLQYKEMKFTNWALGLQLVSTIIHGIFLVTMPVTVPSFYSFHYDELVADKAFRKLWGTMYFGLADQYEER